ncbi:LacI family DNA-binding transcriptional regulator [Actinomycetospora sp. NBRC 106378]|uniref:LacI family DNA-binding transcriptional regulator n=1 Tax=Actinomycetospora sp. NBRC 106378 TaxID=3032208 RepID=UPI0024A5D265|nr:LacI family DNA-binding transcriptional regulator [Actinomycetospora sp. NBRC 106378]GLZ56270.1 LacI family transcriptional regulator [Actinomycetospora sp. NBRC 106378]
MGRPRLADVAAAAGCSTASVSLVLRGAPGPSEATRERVLAAAEQLGYRPDRAASLLARRRSGMLGVVSDVRSTFHSELVEELLAASAQRGFDLLIGARSPARDEGRAVETLVDSRCEALLLLGTTSPPAQLVELDRQVPVVAVSGRASGVDSVRVDDERGAREATEHLLALGHRAVVHVDGGAGEVAADRRRGYERAMAAAGLEPRVVRGGHGEAEGAAARAGLGSATAVTTFNDRAAVGLLDALVRAGVRVPHDVSVAGFDDSPLSRLAHVDLTTVSQDVPALVEHALDLVTTRLDGRVGPAEVVLAPRLVVRGTTGPPENERGALSRT